MHKLNFSPGKNPSESSRTIYPQRSLAEAVGKRAQLLRALPVVLLHLRKFVTVFLEQTIVKHSGSGVHHCLVAMETTTLAHGANSVWKCMVDVMEEHLVPTMPSSQEERHDRVQGL